MAPPPCHLPPLLLDPATTPTCKRLILPHPPCLSLIPVALPCHSLTQPKSKTPTRKAPWPWKGMPPSAPLARGKRCLLNLPSLLRCVASQPKAGASLVEQLAVQPGLGGGALGLYGVATSPEPRGWGTPYGSSHGAVVWVRERGVQSFLPSSADADGSLSITIVVVSISLLPPFPFATPSDSPHTGPALTLARHRLVTLVSSLPSFR